MGPLISLSIAVGISGLLFAAGEAFYGHKLRRIKAGRQGDDFDSFERTFSEGLAREDLQRVYRFFQRWVNDDDFPVGAADSLADVYGIVDEDVDRTIASLSEQCRSELPIHIESERVETVGDVARLVAH